LGVKTRGINKPSTKKAGFLRPSPFHLHKQAEIRRCRALRRRRGAPERRRQWAAAGARGDGGAERRRSRGGRGGRGGGRNLSRLRRGWCQRGPPERDALSGSGGHDGRPGACEPAAASYPPQGEERDTDDWSLHRVRGCREDY